jgi:hypothetical protein
VRLCPTQVQLSHHEECETRLFRCGFPSPADNYLDTPLDFNELVVENLPATFSVRAAGDSMIGINIFPGDIAVVNRAKSVRDRAIVVATVDGAFTLNRFRRHGGRVWLHPKLLLPLTSKFSRGCPSRHGASSPLRCGCNSDGATIRASRLQ